MKLIRISGYKYAITKKDRKTCFKTKKLYFFCKINFTQMSFKILLAETKNDTLRKKKVGGSKTRYAS